MECVVYRRQISPQSDPQTGSGVEDDSALKARPLSPALFYPLVAEQEKITWMHWLPTSLGFECDRVSSRDISYALARLKAPAEVLEEFHWAWNMGLFEAYEICTPPVRRDSRDPLLMGRLGTQWYRLALWGESLLPLEEIAALVQESLRRRARSARLRVGLGLGGTLPGLALVLWLGYLLWNGQPVGTRLLLTFLIFFFTWLPMLVYTPENCQHDFLDRYRR
ncbi:MAG: hypothetical protein HY006_01635 [Candidatus Sungbacteria bacterium]|nr:hypothetical protein [Candidatus Sungbacteria bacterium]